MPRDPNRIVHSVKHAVASSCLSSVVVKRHRARQPSCLLCRTVAVFAVYFRLRWPHRCGRTVLANNLGAGTQSCLSSAWRFVVAFPTLHRECSFWGTGRGFGACWLRGCSLQGCHRVGGLGLVPYFAGPIGPLSGRCRFQLSKSSEAFLGYAKDTPNIGFPQWLGAAILPK